jgi:hypothetical protein
MRFRKTLTLLLLAMGLVFARSAWAQQKSAAPGFNPAKPFTQDQVQGLVRSGLGDESAAKLIDQRGIDSPRRRILSKASRPQNCALCQPAGSAEAHIPNFRCRYHMAAKSAGGPASQS